jgi:hypothetical protein
LYKHVSQRVDLIITGFPAAFIGAFFTGSLLIGNAGFRSTGWDFSYERSYAGTIPRCWHAVPLYADRLYTKLRDLAMSGWIRVSSLIEL